MEKQASLDKETVKNRIFEIVSSKLGVKSVTLHQNLVNDLKADSLDIIELVMSFEDAFELTVPDEDVERIKTVGDVVDYILLRLESEGR